MKKIFLNLSLICFISFFFLQSCKKPDQEGPADKYCTTGQSVGFPKGQRTYPAVLQESTTSPY